MEKTLKVYRASAGSGKTFTLAAEYIALLLSAGEDAHRGLLAVTFTNAATAEMKTRIVSELCDLAQGVEGDFAAAVREKMCVAPDSPLRTKAREALRALIHDYDHFAVTTIDSFFQRLLTSLGHELGLAADLRVDLDDITICDAAVNRILQSVNSREDVKHWVREYIRTNVEDEKGWSITEEIKKFAENNVLSEEFQRGGEELLAFINDDEKMRAYRDKLYAIKQQLKNEMDVLVKPALTLLDSFKEEDVANRGSIMRSFLQKSQSFDKGYSPGKRILEYIEYPERCINGKL
ncbi:MAG: UvrD-helicase domain-containing protein, partial [Alloprevotella sp.]|nr:UvrD-helicase domain-containing protein [Alloprevotella sp.]